MPISLSRLAALSPVRTLVINCGATHVAGAKFRIDLKGRLWLEAFASRPLEAMTLTRKPWAEVVGETLAGLGQGEPWSGPCLVAMSGQHTLTKFVRTELAAKMRRQGVLEFEAQLAIPCPLSEVVWDHATVTEEKGEIDVVLAAAKREVAEGLCAAVSAAGCIPQQVLPASAALLGAIRYNYPEASERSLVVSIGARSTHFLFLGGGRFFSRTFGLGGNTLEHLIADELELSLVAAEQLKRSVLSENTPTDDGANLTAVHHAIGRFEQRLQFELTRSIGLYRERYAADEPTTIFLTGGGTELPKLAQNLAEKFSCRVVRFDVMRRVERAVDCNPDMTVQLPAELVGLGVAAFTRGPGGPNLLPPDRRAKLRLRQRRTCFLASGSLAMAALLPMPVYWHLRAQRAEENLARVEPQLGAMRLYAAKISRDRKAMELIKARTARVRAVVEKKTAWIELMADLQDRLAQVQDVWLEKLQMTSSADGAPTASISRGVTMDGRLLDTNNPLSKVSADSYRRVRDLLRLLGQSPFVTAVKDERFDNTQPGILRFSCTLMLSPTTLL